MEREVRGGIGMGNTCKSMADSCQCMAKSEEELKSLLMKVKEQREKADLKLNIQKTKIIASGPIISWQIDGGKSGNTDKFYLLGLQSHCG